MGALSPVSVESPLDIHFSLKDITAVEEALAAEEEEMARLEQELAAALSKHQELQERKVQLARLQALLNRTPADIVDHIRNLALNEPQRVTFPVHRHSTSENERTELTWDSASSETHIHFRSCLIRREPLLETLQRLPKIERMTFVGCEFDEGVFEAIISADSIPLHLRRLDLWECSGEGLENDVLEEFVKGIAQSDQRIASLTCHPASTTSSDAGLDVLDVVACPRLVPNRSVATHVRHVEWH
jgi:hypothetical protein